MGITTDNFFENIYSVIFSPKAFFEREDMTISIRLAIATLVLITVISKLASGILDGSISSAMFIFSIIWSIISTIFLWFITALFFEYLAKIFDKGGNFARILFYTSFAPIPYIFFAPLNLLKNIEGFGYLLAANAEFLLYLWIIFLYVLAIKAVYKITLSRSFMLVFLPFIASFFAFYWIICFFQKVWYIFSI